MKNKEKAEMVNVSFLLEKEKRRQLRMKAGKRDMSVSELLREAIDQIIKTDDK